MVQAFTAHQSVWGSRTHYRSNRTVLVKGLHSEPPPIRWCGHRPCHSQAARGDRLAAVARLYGTTLGSVADAPAQFPLDLSHRAQSCPALAARGITRSPSATTRIAPTAHPGLPWPDVFA